MLLLSSLATKLRRAGSMAGLTLLGASAMAGHASAQSYSAAAAILSQYNAIIYGTAYWAGDDNGAFVVGGQLNVTSSIGFNTSGNGNAGLTGDPTVPVAGTYGIINVFGTTTGAGAFNIGSSGFTVNLAGASSPITFGIATVNTNYGFGGATFDSAFWTPLTTLSAQLAAQSPGTNVLYRTGGTLTLPDTYTTNAAGQAVFEISLDDLSVVNAVNLKPLAGTTVVINVTGAGILSGNINFNGPESGTNVTNVIWNFEQATAITVPNWQGTVLAENAVITNASQWDGTIVALGLHKSGEIHQDELSPTSLTSLSPPTPPDTTPVPEPASAALFGAGLLGLAAFRRRFAPFRLRAPE